VVQLHGLEQVTLCAGLQRRRQIVLVFADRQHQDAGSRRRFLERRDAVHTPHARQVVVQQDQIGLAAFQAAQRFTDVAGLGSHLEASILREQRNQPTAKQVVIIHHQQRKRFHVTAQHHELESCS